MNSNPNSRSLTFSLLASESKSGISPACWSSDPLLTSLQALVILKLHLNIYHILCDIYSNAVKWTLRKLGLPGIWSSSELLNWLSKKVSHCRRNDWFKKINDWHMTPNVYNMINLVKIANTDSVWMNHTDSVCKSNTCPIHTGEGSGTMSVILSQYAAAGGGGRGRNR